MTSWRTIKTVSDHDKIKEADLKEKSFWNVRYRNGFIVMLRPSRPVRLWAFVQIQVGKHLRKLGEEWRLIFDGSEMKSGRPYQLPREVMPFLEQYLFDMRQDRRGLRRPNFLAPLPALCRIDDSGVCAG